MTNNQQRISFRNETCKIGSKIIKVSELSDEQLDSLYFFLRSRYKLSKRQSKRLEAVSSERTYRSVRDLKVMMINHNKVKTNTLDMKKKMVVANRAATIIIKWLKFNTMLYKTEVA